MMKQITTVLAAALAMACSDSDGMFDPPQADELADVEATADSAAVLQFGRSHGGHANVRRNYGRWHDRGRAREYEITITNLATGQPLSPGVIVTHNKWASFFSVGDAASDGLRFIAESGDPSTAETELMDTRGVDGIVATMAPIHRVGGPGPTSLTTTITARGSANRFSLAVMLICTNDGFVGLDGVRLPNGFKPRTYYAPGYDAGTELNDETSLNVVDGCAAIGPVGGDADGNGHVAEGGVVRLHPGIQGGAFLDPALHDWIDPVARVTVRRIK